MPPKLLASETSALKPSHKVSLVTQYAVTGTTGDTLSNYTETTVTGATSSLSSNTRGLLAGVGTFVLVCGIFGAVGCIAMCRLRSKARQQQINLKRHDRATATQQGTVHLLTPSHSATGGVNNSGYDTCNQIKKSITIKHFMKNGFHVETDEDCDSPCKRALTKVNSTPPKIEVSDEVHSNSNVTISGSNGKGEGMLLQVQNCLKRATSLKVPKGTAEVRV